MFAVAKEDAIEFIRYTGIHLLYPLWFLELIEDGYVFEEFGGHIYSSEQGELAIAEGDVFLLNRYGDIRHMDSRQFNDIFYETQ